jgi:hypothetical protein
MAVLDKDQLIEFIVSHNPAINKAKLENLSEISLFLISIQVEIEISRRHGNNDNSGIMSQRN